MPIVTRKMRSTYKQEFTEGYVEENYPHIGTTKSGTSLLVRLIDNTDLAQFLDGQGRTEGGLLGVSAFTEWHYTIGAYIMLFLMALVGVAQQDL